MLTIERPCSLTIERRSRTSSPGSMITPSRVSSQPMTKPFFWKGSTARRSRIIPLGYPTERLLSRAGGVLRLSEHGRTSGGIPHGQGAQQRARGVGEAPAGAHRGEVAEVDQL